MKSIRQAWKALAVLTTITLSVIFTQIAVQSADPGQTDRNHGLFHSVQAFKADIQRLRTLAAN